MTTNSRSTKQPGDTSRRKFLKTAGAAAAALAAPMFIPASALGRDGSTAPSERIAMGFIGLGGQGSGHLMGGAWTYVPGGYVARKDVQVQAVCDVVRDRREKARKRCNQVYAERFNQADYNGVTAYNDFREVLARPDIDAVLIALPYHWAAMAAMAAMRAGKDVYCEKPMAVTMREATCLLATAKRYERIYQAGTQQRSEYGGKFRLACELIRNERIGQLKEVYAYCPPGAMFPSDWVTENSKPVPDGTDWDMWLGPLPWRPYVRQPAQTVPGLFVGDINWGPHHYDVIQWMVNPDVTAPIKAEYDKGQIHYHYSNGVVVHSAAYPGEKVGAVGGGCFVGTKGRIAVDRDGIVSYPERILKEPLRPQDIRVYRAESHSGNFLECIRTRRPTICNPDAAVYTMRALLTGGIALALKRDVTFDPVKAEFINDPEANRLCSVRGATTLAGLIAAQFSIFPTAKNNHMKRIFSINVLVVLLLALAVITARADDETNQFAILHSDASVSKKWAACQRLRVIGTAKAVQEVAALLTDEKLSQAARQTLDGLPYPEVDDVLRDALSKTSGLLKAGIVDSMGWRGKPASLPLLIPLLSDADANVAAASATALGRIGGRKAIAALTTARDQSPAVVQAAARASLLQCAERLREKNDKADAAAIFRGLYDDKYPIGIHTAAWRGLVLSDSAHQAELMVAALRGTDHALELAAIQVLRESNDRRLVRACASRWDMLPAQAQSAVCDAEVKQGADGLRVVRNASRSPHLVVRMAAWTALGNLNDLASIPALAQAAAAGDETERQAARDSLARLRGTGVSKALLAAVKPAASPEKVELLRALGSRQDGNSTQVLLENAAAGDAAVRRAALDSLREIAPQQALSPLLEIAAKAGSDDLRQPALDALAAICQVSPDKDATTRTVVEVEGRLPATEQGAFFDLLAGLGTPAALAAVQTASRSQDLDLAKQAVRALAQWPSAAPADSLLDLAHTTTDTALSTLALRGAIAVNGTEPEVSKRMAFLKKALEVARRPDEKKQALSQIGQIFTPEALAVAVNALADPDVANEAALAVLDIAEKLAKSNPQLAWDAAAKVLNKEAKLFQRVWALRPKSAKHIPFIRDWVLCGPYSKPGVTGATAIFNVAFGPELRDEKVEWKDAPSEDRVGLGKLFPDAENCDAYLRTTIVVPEDCSGMLLMGSDDGIKAWLNGAVVHSNNVDRGEVVDQDVAPVMLKKGANELVLKISQGGAGWSACARIVGTDGNPIPGLEIQRPTEASGVLAGAE